MKTFSVNRERILDFASVLHVFEESIASRSKK
jgi:hypothetical protein